MKEIMMEKAEMENSIGIYSQLTTNRRAFSQEVLSKHTPCEVRLVHILTNCIVSYI